MSISYRYCDVRLDIVLGLGNHIMVSVAFPDSRSCITVKCCYLDFSDRASICPYPLSHYIHVTDDYQKSHCVNIMWKHQKSTQYCHNTDIKVLDQKCCNYWFSLYHPALMGRLINKDIIISCCPSSFHYMTIRYYRLDKKHKWNLYSQSWKWL